MTIAAVAAVLLSMPALAFAQTLGSGELRILGLRLVLDDGDEAQTAMSNPIEGGPSCRLPPVVGEVIGRRDPDVSRRELGLTRSGGAHRRRRAAVGGVRVQLSDPYARRSRLDWSHAPSAQSFVQTPQVGPE
jgi:hypothetical protein